MPRQVIALPVVAVVVFVAGLLIGSTGIAGFRPAILTGDGYVGDRVATISVGGTSFGARASVPWRDAAGSEHDGGWPDCLTPGSVTGIPFTGATVWHGASGQATILWVDCSGR